MNKRPRPPFLARSRITLLACLCFTSGAADITLAGHEPGSEALFFDELPTVLSASRLSQPLQDAPGAVTVIDREMILASGARNVAELMRWAPGFQVGYRRGYLPLVTYHGLSDDVPRRLLVRIDGRSAYSPYLISGAEWHKITVDLDDIERIEIFRGTNSAAYGNQAFMGVVNIITRAAADSARLRVRVGQGANGIRDRNVSIGHRTGPIALRLTAGHGSDRGIESLNDSHRRHHADLRADWQLSPDHRLELHAGTVRLTAGSGRADQPTNPERTIRDGASFGQVRWSWQPSVSEELKLTLYRHEDTSRDAFTLSETSGVGLPPGMFVDIDYRHRVLRDDIELEHTFSPGPNTRIVWGMGHRRDRIKAPQIYNKDSIQYRSDRLFGNLEWRFNPKWILNAGLMAEATKYDNLTLAPRIALNYRAAKHHTLRASIGRGYRSPTPFEREADMQFRERNSDILLAHSYHPSPGMKAERITVRELGYLGEIPGISLSLDIRLFEERLTRMTRNADSQSYLAPGNPMLDGRNFASDDSATVRGVELSTMWRPARRTWIGLNYAHIRIDSTNDRAERSAPHHSASLFAAWSPVREWSVSIAHHYVDSMSWYARESLTLRPYRRTDVRLARAFAVGDARGEFALVLAHTGRHYADFRPELQSPRQLYARFSLEF